MPRADLILAVDIGGDSIKIAEFSYPPGGGMILEKFSFTEYGGDLKDEEIMASLETAFKTAVTEQKFSAKKVCLSISSQSTFTRFVKLSDIPDSEAKVKQMVEFEAKQTFPFPMNEVVWDYQLISSPESENEMEVMFVMVKNEIIDQITNIISSAGLEISLIEVASISSYNSARANGIGNTECEMVLNIGGRVSNLVFIDSGSFFVRPIPIAGLSITQQISKEFKIPFPDGEEMKKRHGFVALGGAYEEPDSEVAATVSKIVRNVMTRLHGEINRSINVYRSQLKGRKPAKLWLAGGSSVMAFTPRFFSEKLRIPVDYFNPFQVVSLSPEIDKEKLGEVAHMFSEVIGLGLRHITMCPIEVSLMPEKLKKQKEIRQKAPYFYAAAASLLLCLGITLWGVSRQHQVDVIRVDVAKKVVNATSDLSKKIKSEQNSIKGYQKNFADAKAMLDNRKKWPELLNDLQKCLPDRIWLTQIKGTTSPVEGGSSMPGPSQAAPIFPIFGAGPAKQAAAAPAAEIAWLHLEGHSLVGKQNATLEEDFKKNLAKSEFFTVKSADEFKINYTPARGGNNVSFFKIDVKLKRPIKK